MELAPTAVSASAGDEVGFADKDPPGVLGTVVVAAAAFAVVAVVLLPFEVEPLLAVVVVAPATVVVVLLLDVVVDVVVDVLFELDECPVFLAADAWDGPDDPQAARARLPATTSTATLARLPGPAITMVPNRSRCIRTEVLSDVKGGS
jgi:hypothetical protein